MHLDGRFRRRNGRAEQMSCEQVNWTHVRADAICLPICLQPAPKARIDFLAGYLIFRPFIKFDKTPKVSDHARAQVRVKTNKQQRERDSCEVVLAQGGA